MQELVPSAYFDLTLHVGTVHDQINSDLTWHRTLIIGPCTIYLGARRLPSGGLYLMTNSYPNYILTMALKSSLSIVHSLPNQGQPRTQTKRRWWRTHSLKYSPRIVVVAAVCGAKYMAQHQLAKSKIAGACTLHRHPRQHLHHLEDCCGTPSSGFWS